MNKNFSYMFSVNIDRLVFNWGCQTKKLKKKINLITSLINILLSSDIFSGRFFEIFNLKEKISISINKKISKIIF